MSIRLQRGLLTLIAIAAITTLSFAATFKITGGTLTLPSGIVTDDSVSDTAAINSSKLKHLYHPGTNFDLAVGGTPATREETVFVATTSGTVKGFHWLLTDTGTSTSITWNLKKNGTTVLSGTGSSTHSDTDGQVGDGTISVPSFVADDRFTITMTVSSATGAVGPFAWGEFEESAP